MPDRLLLHVDGIGRFLILRSNTIQVGAASRSRTIDLPLITDGIDAPIEIRRRAADYFLTATEPIEINGKPRTSRLLTDRDTIRVGRRGQIRFLKPVAASGTAILELTSAAMRQTDVRRVVLFADALILGAGRTAHLAARCGQQPYVIHDDQGQLAVRASGAGSRALELNRTVEIDELRLRLTAFEPNTPPADWELR